MTEIIDAHHHFWRYNAAEYGWIDDSMSALRRDFLAPDLARELEGAGVDRVISVQARQSVDETRWLLQTAATNPFIAGVVGWVPLAGPGLQLLLEELSANPNLKGVRHVLQGELDEYMLSSEFQRGIALLARFGLAYDILIHERQLPAAIALADRNPDQIFILDHLAKPLIRSGTMEPWASLIRQLAERPNVYCKISGMVTEDDWARWSLASLQSCLDTALEAFTPARLMYGSDWPVCLVASSYPRWLAAVRAAIAGLSPDEQSSILAGTAERAYRLPSGLG